MGTAYKRNMKKIQTILYSFPAAGEFVALTRELKGNVALSNALNNLDFANFVQIAFNTSITIGAVLAVARIGYGGFLYMGSDSWSTKTRAKEVLVDAVTGLVLLISVVLILQYINPNILKLDIIVSPTTNQP